MKTMKTRSFVMALTAFALGSAHAAPPEVTNVIVKRSAENGGRVLVKYTAAGAGIATFQFRTNGVPLEGGAAVSVDGEINRLVAAGTHAFLWDDAADLPLLDVQALTAAVSLWSPDTPPLYCAVSLVDSPPEVLYFTGRSEIPGGEQDNRWKTDWLLLRQVPASPPDGGLHGVFPHIGQTERGAYNWKSEDTNSICCERVVRITKPFWTSVYQVTQRQWCHVMGTWPSYFNNPDFRDMRPVEKVSYNMARGTPTASEYNWPGHGHSVDPASFMGMLRTQTGIAFDLPTEAQWEYACRAGTLGAWNNGADADGYKHPEFSSSTPAGDRTFDTLGRYTLNGGVIPKWNSDIKTNEFDEEYDAGGWDLWGTTPAANADLEYGTAVVGSYLPNAWGLYDMHGNVFEWCLDVYRYWDGAEILSRPFSHLATMSGDDPAGMTDTVLNGESRRVIRGGTWGNAYSWGTADRAKSYHREYGGDGLLNPDTSHEFTGLRVAASIGTEPVPEIAPGDVLAAADTRSHTTAVSPDKPQATIILVK